MKVVVSNRGRITIPKPLRTRLGISAGTVLDFEVDGELLVAHEATDPVDAARGLLNLGESVDSFIESTRGRRSK